jgi:Cu/Ag efflux protein CusF
MLGACGKKTDSTGQSLNREFEVRGILRGIATAEKEVTIEHEEIPEYMPSMSMPFAVKDMKEVQGLAVGDAVQFKYVVTPDDSWVTNLRKIDAKLVRLPAAAAEPTDAPKVGAKEEKAAAPPQ